jgi:hypothetical protein
MIERRSTGRSSALARSHRENGFGRGGHGACHDVVVMDEDEQELATTAKMSPSLQSIFATIRPSVRAMR